MQWEVDQFAVSVPELNTPLFILIYKFQTINLGEFKNIGRIWEATWEKIEKILDTRENCNF